MDDRRWTDSGGFFDQVWSERDGMGVLQAKTQYVWSLRYIHSPILRDSDAAEGALLRDADFRECDLQGACFDGANLTNAHFQGARLAGAGFRDADLEGANFEGADLRGACLLSASFLGTTFVSDEAPGAGAQLDGTTQIATAAWEQLAPRQAHYLRQHGGRGSDD